MVSTELFWWRKGFSKAERAAAGKAASALCRFPDAITLASALSPGKLQACLQHELSRNPELFFVSGFRLLYSPLAAVAYPQYTCPKPDCRAAWEACRERAAQLVNRVHGPDDYAKALQVHDLLARNVAYVTGASQDLNTILGPLTKKQGVCQGFARTFQYLLDRLGIPCETVYGFSRSPENGREESHAWNLARLDGSWAHIDVTFDTTVRSGQVLRYDYFGLSTQQVLRDHRYDPEKYPAAGPAGLGYYERNRLVMDTRAQLREYMARALHAGKTDCVFQLPGAVPSAGLAEKVSAEVQSLLWQLDVSLGYTVHFNLAQRVFHITFER